MESGDQLVRLEVEPRQVRLNRFRDGLDVNGIVMVARRDTNRRLPPHFHQSPEGLIAGRSGSGGGILRIERQQQKSFRKPCS